LAARRCTICGKYFQPDHRARRHQKCCSPACSKKLKRRRDRFHKQRYRETGLGKEQRRKEERRRRDKVGWKDYMRFWRKAEPKQRSRQERERAKRYYQAHRDGILAKRRKQRTLKNDLQICPSEACSH
jgi:hypothetical protein